MSASPLIRRSDESTLLNSLSSTTINSNRSERLDSSPGCLDNPQTAKKAAFFTNTVKAVSIIAAIGTVAAIAFKFAPLWAPVLLASLGPIGFFAVIGTGAVFLCALGVLGIIRCIGSSESADPLTSLQETPQQAKQNLDQDRRFNTPATFPIEEQTKRIPKQDAIQNTVYQAPDTTLIPFQREKDDVTDGEFLSDRINMHALIQDAARRVINGKNATDDTNLIQLTSTDLTDDKVCHDYDARQTSYTLYCQEKLQIPNNYLLPILRTPEEWQAADIYDRKTSEDPTYYRITATVPWDFKTIVIDNIEEVKAEEIPEEDKKSPELSNASNSDLDLISDAQVHSEKTY